MDGAHGGTGWNENGHPQEKKNTQITQIFLCVMKRWMEIAGREGSALWGGLGGCTWQGRGDGILPLGHFIPVYRRSQAFYGEV